MKFYITSHDAQGKEVLRVSGFQQLQDACHAATALVWLRKEETFFHIRIDDEHLACVGNIHPTYNTADRVESDAAKALAKYKEKKKQFRARMKFLTANGGSDFFDRVNADQSARTALFANDFPAVLARLAELEVKVAA